MEDPALAQLWARLTADEKNACREILRRGITGLVMQNMIVEAVGGAGKASTVALVEALVRKGVLKKRSGTYWLEPAVDLAALVPKPPEPADWPSGPPDSPARQPRVSTLSVGPATVTPEDGEEHEEPGHNISPDQIIATVATVADLPVAVILEKGESVLQSVAEWRAIAIYLVRTHCQDGRGILMTFTRIGQIFGMRQPTTISTAYFAVRSFLEHGDQWYGKRVAQVEQRLGLNAPSTAEPELPMKLTHQWGDSQP